MKAGEYIGKDGREYRWLKQGEYYAHWQGGYANVAAADWPAAKSALDALIEQQSGEWVEIRQNDDEYTGLRCRVDGSQPQWFKDFDGKWHDEEAGEDTEWLVAYRKGRSVAQQESADLRDAARELVEAVLDNETMKGTLQPGPGEYGYALIDQRDWNHIVTVSKALEDKL